MGLDVDYIVTGAFCVVGNAVLIIEPGVTVNSTIWEVILMYQKMPVSGLMVQPRTPSVLSAATNGYLVKNGGVYTFTPTIRKTNGTMSNFMTEEMQTD